MKYLLLAAFIAGIVVVMVWWIWFIEVRDLRLEGRAGAGGGTLAMANRQVRYTAGPHARVIVVSVLPGMNRRIAADPASVALLACLWRAESARMPACQGAQDDPVALGHG